MEKSLYMMNRETASGKKRFRNQYLERRGHNVRGIGELGSSDGESERPKFGVSGMSMKQSMSQSMLGTVNEAPLPSILAQGMAINRQDSAIK